MTRHETDWFSLAAGVVFTLFGLAFMVALLGDWNLDTRWVFPLMLIGLGAGGVAASLTSARREQEQYEVAAAEWAAEQAGVATGTDTTSDPGAHG